MTEQLTQPETHELPRLVAIVNYKYGGGPIAVASIDCVEYGALVITMDGSVKLWPWHTITEVNFFDVPEPSIPEVEDPAAAAGVKGHEGSE